MLGDDEAEVWEAWRDGNGRPQYIVMDRDMNIVLRGEGTAGHQQTEDKVLELLGAR